MHYFSYISIDKRGVLQQEYSQPRIPLFVTFESTKLEYKTRLRVLLPTVEGEGVSLVHSMLYPRALTPSCDPTGAKSRTSNMYMCVIKRGLHFTKANMLNQKYPSSYFKHQTVKNDVGNIWREPFGRHSSDIKRLHIFYAYKIKLMLYFRKQVGPIVDVFAAGYDNEYFCILILQWELLETILAE